MAEAGKKLPGLDIPGGDAAQWPLQRYGRFMPSGTGEPPGSGPEAGMACSPTWKDHTLRGKGLEDHERNGQPGRKINELNEVFDSNEESGYLVLTIVISGHFFISQGQTLLNKDFYQIIREQVQRCSTMIAAEGFSLIGSKNWLKIVRRMDCLLFGTTIKDKSRMFRVQFGGASPEQALEHCRSCVQSLTRYITVQALDGASGQQPGPPTAAGGPGLGREPNVPRQHGHYSSSAPAIFFKILPKGQDGVVDYKCQQQPEQPPEQQQWVPASTCAPGRTSVTRLAQSLLASEELPLAYEQPAWSVEELGPFLRLCLLDQNFPAFVEEVERELKKLTRLGN